MSNSNPTEDHQYYDIFQATSDYESGDIITYSTSNGISEIEEEEDDVSNGIVEELFETRKFAPMPSIREEYDKRSVASTAEDSIHVAVGKSLSSAQALDWALRNALDSPSTVLYLIHIFPETKQIPTPLGKLPLNQVSPEQVESFMAQERGKRRELLQKFISKCSVFNVTVDTILIESDGLPKAILDLVDILHIRKLVVGTTKSSLRKLRSRKGTGTADLLLKGAPETCELKIICEGAEVVIDHQAVESPLSHRGSDFDISKEFDKSISIRENEVNEVEKMDDREKSDEANTSCMCFK